MVEWNPLIAALALLVAAIAAAIPSLVTLYTARVQKAHVTSNSRKLDIIKDQTNGNFEQIKAAVQQLNMQGTNHSQERLAQLEQRVHELEQGRAGHDPTVIHPG